MERQEPKIMRRIIAAMAAAFCLGSVAISATTADAAGVDYLPTTEQTPTYSKFQPTTDPGSGASNYFQPYWYAKNASGTGGTHIQAHGGQVVQVKENGKNVYYWYGEDRSNGYDNSPGVHAYRSTDLYNWTDLGVALRSVSKKAELTDKNNPNFEYFNSTYGLTKSDGSVDTAKAEKLFTFLNSYPDQDGDGKADSVQAIFERPKIIYNQKNKEYVLWWHSDGSTTPGGSNYARALAGVAVSKNPAGPFKLVGAYRLPNQNNWKQAAGNPSWGEDGDSRDMTVFVDPKDQSAYVVYSSEANATLYIAKLNDDYTNVVKTTSVDQSEGQKQYSESGQYPYILADGTADAPVRGKDFQIVKQNGSLEAPAVFMWNGRYNIIASGATGWSPNKQTYYTSDSMLGSWIRGVQSDDANENTWYNSMPEGSDGLLSVGDKRGTTFGSQSASVLAVDQKKGHFIYLGDRWDSGKADSTYVWLPLTIGENGKIEMHNPAQEGEADGWTTDYWDNHGGAKIDNAPYWTVTDDGLPDTVNLGDKVSLPSEVTVKTGDAAAKKVAVTWSKLDTSTPGKQTITGTLAEDDTFHAGRTFTRTINVGCSSEVSSPWNVRQWNGGSSCVVSSKNNATTFYVADNKNNGVWTDRNGGSAIVQWDRMGEGDSIVTTVVPKNLGGNVDPRAGLGARESFWNANGDKGKGYVLLLASPSGVYMQWDSDNNHYIDKEGTHVGTGFGQIDGDGVQLKLTRDSATKFTGYWRNVGDSEWQKVQEVTLPEGIDAKLDAGVFATSNNNQGTFTTLFKNTYFDDDVAALESLTIAGKSVDVDAASADEGVTEKVEDLDGITKDAVKAVAAGSATTEVDVADQTDPQAKVVTVTVTSKDGKTSAVYKVTYVKTATEPTPDPNPTPDPDNPGGGNNGSGSGDNGSGNGGNGSGNGSGDNGSGNGGNGSGTGSNGNNDGNGSVNGSNTDADQTGTVSTISSTGSAIAGVAVALVVLVAAAAGVLIAVRRHRS